MSVVGATPPHSPPNGAPVHGVEGSPVLSSSPARPSHPHTQLPAPVALSKSPQTPDLNISILVHNVSHSDMLVSVLAAATSALSPSSHATSPASPVPPIHASNPGQVLVEPGVSSTSTSTSDVSSKAASASAPATATPVPQADRKTSESSVVAVSVLGAAVSGESASLIARPKFHQFKVVGDSVREVNATF
jgi:hypothetical protein